MRQGLRLLPGKLLPYLFTLTLAEKINKSGIFSVALSFQRLIVRRILFYMIKGLPALRSPDFPLTLKKSVNDCPLH